MAPTNRVLEALAVEALRRVPELTAFVGRIANALETIADAQAFQALKAYGDSLYPTADKPDEARALQAARVIAGRGAVRIGKRLAIRAGARAEADTAEHPENDTRPRRRARRPTP